MPPAARAEISVCPGRPKTQTEQQSLNISLTVFFEDPFWVGVFERLDEGKLSVCKVTFGAEPKDYEVWDYVLSHYHELVFSPAV